MSNPREKHRHNQLRRERKEESGHNVALSKGLSWLLRHNALQEGLLVHPGGWVNTSDILAHQRFNRWTLQDIQKVVEENDKKRFSLRNDPDTQEIQIRANQGHSFHVDDFELEEIKDASECTAVIHGTYLRHWDSIRKSGLSRMSRNHIHFAPGEPGSQGVISGMRTSAQIYIHIDLHLALKDGLRFYRSENNVVLSPGNADGYIEPKYFLKVVSVKSGQVIFPTK